MLRSLRRPLDQSLARSARSLQAAPRLEDYQEFFDFTPELEKRAS